MEVNGVYFQRRCRLKLLLLWSHVNEKEKKIVKKIEIYNSLNSFGVDLL